MRARHRHFNPKDAGATFGWDTRYNSDGHTNNGAVGTWTDRFSNTATQTATTPTDRRPTWKDNATDNINGIPVLSFDGTNDLIETASTTTSGALSCVSVVKRPWTTGKFSPICGTAYGENSGKGFLSTGGVFQDFQNKDMFLVGNGFKNGQAPRAVGSYGAIADNTPRIMTGTLSSSRSRIFMDGASISSRVESAASVPSSTAAVQIGGFLATNDWGNMSFGLLVYYKDAAIADPLRKRLEHAAAYSFKLSCN